MKIYFLNLVCIPLFLNPNFAQDSAYLIPWLSGDKYGLADQDGRLVVPAKYEEVMVYKNFPFALFRAGELWGVVDGRGHEIMKATINGKIAGQYSSLFSGVSVQKAFYPSWHKSSSTFADVPLYCVQDPTNRKLYFFHPSHPENKMIPFLDPELMPKGQEKQWPYSSYDGFIQVLTEDSLVNFLDTTGRLIFDHGWSWAKSVSPYVIAVKNETQKIDLYARDGSLISRTSYDNTGSMFDDYFLGETKSSGPDLKTYDLLSPKGDLLVTQQQIRPSLHDGLVITYDHTTAELRDASGKIITTFPNAKINFLKEGSPLLSLHINGKVGLMDRNGNIIFSPRYDILDEIKPKMFYFRDKIRAGMVTGEGMEVWSRDSIELDLRINNPSGYYHAMTIDPARRRHGVVDSTGRFVLKPIYDTYRYNEKWDCFSIQLGDSLGVVNRAGKFVFPMTYQAILGAGEHHPFAIQVKDTVFFYSKDFVSLGESVKKKSSVTVKREGNSAFLISADGAKLTSGQYNYIETANDVITGIDIFLGFYPDGKKDSFDLFDKHGKRIIPSGYVLWARTMQDASDDAASLVVTNRYDIQQKNRNPRRGLIDGTGKWILLPDTFNIWVIGSEVIVKQSRNLKKTSLYDLTGKLINDTPYAYHIRRPDDGASNETIIVSFETGGIAYTNYCTQKSLDDVQARLNTYATHHTMPKYLYGALQTSGKEIFPVRFTNIAPFHFNYTCAEEINEHGEPEGVVIHKNGETMLRTKYKLRGVMYEDSTLLLFEQGDKLGLLDLHGNVVVEPVFEHITMWDNQSLKMIMCRDATASYIINRNEPGTRLYAGPAGSMRILKFGTTIWYSEIETKENGVSMIHWRFFHDDGTPGGYIAAHKVDFGLHSLPLTEGYIILRDTPASKPYFYNYLKDLKFKDQNPTLSRE